MLSAWSQLLEKHAQEHDSGLETDKKLVNHSTRKHLVQKLVDNDIPPGEIIQITRHKNVNSLNNYSSLSDKKQQQISAVLSNAASTSQILSAVSIEDNTKAESSLSGATLGSLFQNCQIATVNVQVYQSGRTEKSSKIRCEKKLKITVSDDSRQSQLFLQYLRVILAHKILLDWV